MPPKQSRVIVVGGGLAGLTTTIKLAEAGMPVDLFSIVPVKRSHSVCAQGGINAAKNLKGEGDSPEIHFDDTVYGGDFLANQPPVKGMCYAAPGIIDLFDRMGVMFNRTAEGLLDFRRFGGTLYHRTAFAGATTGQQLLYALDEQVRRWEAAGRVTKYELWEFLRVVRDEGGTCRGIVAVNIRNLEVRAFRADAVVLATGGPGLIFGRSTNSMINTGAANSRAYQQGAIYANGEFIQVHPTAIPGEDKLRLMSESARGEGGRVWVWGDSSKVYRNPFIRDANGNPKEFRCGETGKPWYFLEEMYPKYGNLVPRDIATREIFMICTQLGMGINGQNKVYLDLTHIPEEELNRKLGGILEIYEKFVGVDPRKQPMEIFPAVHYSMGGLWCDYNQMTNIPGLYVVGEADYQYHGANRLGANSLLSCIYAGMVAGSHIPQYIKSLSVGATDVSSAIFDAEQRQEEADIAQIQKMDGDENAFALWRELGDWMNKNVTIVRYNKALAETDAKLRELLERWKRIDVNDTNRTMNTSVLFTKQLRDMLHLARCITLGALARNESRGAHYKPEFPDRDDKNWLKTTKATFTPDGPSFDYEPVDVSLIPPRPRKYASD
ncbi:MAG: succinate dehydrogenase flavoprotein subunit [Candidatus Sumerlaea sp.]|jgi:succinate dehydrogenase / fumarate reductase flavoprotein subunit|uniref:succinate dehydrogenase n=1 Tax=Sumerlaea chitinivorans TaxID=2250252 RepID=A0A2Z4Y6P7_SUMC1|nr:Succinate dehydrogenase flavoprotein subunit [Candidatus Sumerlaea chitinivorans]GIX44927.1 MAG: succinate dehydrogenase flavoprotein subunit [Candidatus Sumerlaea sp.]